MNITFRTDGTGRCLYTELIDLKQIGRLHVERASNVEFDNETQQWRVLVNSLPAYSSPSHQECLGWEQQHLGG